MRDTTPCGLLSWYPVVWSVLLVQALTAEAPCLLHHASGGGRCVGAVEHRCRHLWLLPHQCHGGEDPHTGECPLYPSVCDCWPVCRPHPAHDLYTVEKTLKPPNTVVGHHGAPDGCYHDATRETGSCGWLQMTIVKLWSGCLSQGRATSQSKLRLWKLIRWRFSFVQVQGVVESQQLDCRLQNSSFERQDTQRFTGDFRRPWSYSSSADGSTLVFSTRSVRSEEVSQMKLEHPNLHESSWSDLQLLGSSGHSQPTC